jgi:hypothetical protein
MCPNGNSRSGEKEISNSDGAEMMTRIGQQQQASQTSSPSDNPPFL